VNHSGKLTRRAPRGTPLLFHFHKEKLGIHNFCRVARGRILLESNEFSLCRACRRCMRSKEGENRGGRKLLQELGGSSGFKKKFTRKTSLQTQRGGFRRRGFKGASAIGVEPSSKGVWDEINLVGSTTK